MRRPAAGSSGAAGVEPPERGLEASAIFLDREARRGNTVGPRPTAYKGRAAALFGRAASRERKRVMSLLRFAHLVSSVAGSPAGVPVRRPLGRGSPVPPGSITAGRRPPRAPASPLRSPPRVGGQPPTHHPQRPRWLPPRGRPRGAVARCVPGSPRRGRPWGVRERTGEKGAQGTRHRHAWTDGSSHHCM